MSGPQPGLARPSLGKYLYWGQAQLQRSLIGANGISLFGVHGLSQFRVSRNGRLACFKHSIKQIYSSHFVRWVVWIIDETDEIMAQPTSDKPLYTLANGRLSQSCTKSIRELTASLGQPSDNPGSVRQVRYGDTNGGLVVLADVQLVEVLAHFARERIPERQVSRCLIANSTQMHTIDQSPGVSTPKPQEPLANSRFSMMYPI